MAIKMRTGKEADLDISKAIPGEWLVSTDTRIVRMCVVPGIVLRMATYEAFEADMAQIEAILAEAKSIQSAISRIHTEVNSKAALTIEYAESAAESADIAYEEAERAKMYAGIAESVTGIEIATQDRPGLMRGGDNLIGEDGELILTKTTTEETLYNSYDGGIKINSITAVESKQETTTGAQFFNKATATKGYKLSGYGGLYEDDTMFVTDYISVEGLTNIVTNIKTDSTETRCDLYDFQKNFVGGMGASAIGANVIPITPDISYVRIDGLLSMLDTAIVANGTELPPYESFSNRVASPSPEYPQEIESVKGKNELDCRGLVEKTIGGIKFTPVKDENGNLLYVEVNGTSSADVIFNLLNDVALDTNKEHIISDSANASITTHYTQLYFSDATSLPNSDDNKQFVPEDVLYTARIIIKSGYTANQLRFYPMIRPASIADDTYVPYGLLRFKTVGAQLLEYDDNFNKTRNGVTIKTNADKTLSIIGNGTDYASGIEILGKDFTFSGSDIVLTLKAGNYYVSGLPKGLLLYFYRTGDEPNAVSCSEDGVFTLSEDTNFCSVSLRWHLGTTFNSPSTKIMLNVGTEPLPWQPYQSSSITLSTPITLHGIGDAKDRIVRKDGVWGVERKVSEVVFDGSDDEGWSLHSKGMLYCKVSDSAIYNIQGVALCDQLIQSDYNLNTVTGNVFAVGSQGVYVGVNDTYSTGNELKSHLQNKPMIFMIQTIEPTFEPLPTADQIALNSLLSFDTVTYLSCDSEMQPVIEVEYGTSKVGAYTLDAWNKAENNRIRIEEVTTAMLALNQE